MTDPVAGVLVSGMAIGFLTGIVVTAAFVVFVRDNVAPAPEENGPGPRSIGASLLTRHDVMHLRRVAIAHHESAQLKRTNTEAAAELEESKQLQAIANKIERILG